MKSLFVGGLALFSLVGGTALASPVSTMSVNYYSVAEPTTPTASADFGPCCSSPPATYPYIDVGSSLSANGRPMQSLTPSGLNGTPAQMVVGQEIQWWTPSVTNGISADGTGVITLPFSDGTFFVPQGTGGNNGSAFQTAMLSGIIHASADAKLTVTGDDDILVYLNGKYVDGIPGVHGSTSKTIDLGAILGDESLTIFYADRAQVAAVLGLSVDGATISAVPEPSTWAMMILGFAGLGFMAYRRRQNGSSFRLA